MRSTDFRAVYLPYCIEQTEDGSWLVLNRHYKPVGFNTEDHIKYSEYPVASTIKGLGPATLKKLSYTGVVSGNRVYLYNDGSNPLNGPTEMAAYLKRIEVLAKLSITQ